MNHFKHLLSFFLLFLAFNVLASTDQYIRLGGGGGSASAASIGDVITGGTSGSVLFIDTSTKLAQDNVKLFWDDTNFRLGLGNGAPTKTLDVTGTAKVSVGLIIPLIYPPSDGTSGLNITKADGTTSVLDVDTTNSRVGIGSATPAKTLDVVGTGKFSTSLVTPLIYPAADSTAAIQFDKADGTTPIVTIDSTNKRVGIGSATPASVLDVVGASNLAAMTVLGATNNSTDALGAVFKGPNANDAGIMLWSTAGTPQKWTFRVNGSAGPFQFIDTTNGTTAMSIASGTENVSIGNGYSANVAALDVKGGIRMNTTATKPTCDATTRGEMWAQQVGAGTTDTLFICLKAAADTYSWISIVTGG